ncbi:Cna B-type domain-containing protein [Clostridium sp.]|uniref:Cna B-type domain-containing protein n=1 Tax=Clostridium sp. TaxID=1506 RepID=UPI002913F6C0|nr:Cna B-type domain-containing protein [Clostridium sp.]MDU5108082.1 Cna B-type domain-containing protein [Clostridium sp.]
MIKKLISSILSVTILASCITFSNSEATVKADSTTTNSSIQIVENGAVNEIASDNVTTLKTITGTDVENEFQITLQVTTEEELKNINICPDAATVLVLDRSGSMSTNSGKTTRFKAMQQAANSFLIDFANVQEGSNAKRLVSIVSFASDVKNETYSNGVNNWIDVAKSSTDLTQATSKINNLSKPNGGTNIEGALIMANNIVKNGKDNNLLIGSDGKVISNINIILLTDGCPTFHMGEKADTSSIKELEGTEGGGDKAYTTDWEPVGGKVNTTPCYDNCISKTIKDSGINLYTIAFSTSDAKFYTKDPSILSWGNYEYINPSTWMEGFATRNFSANDVDELTKQFEKINKLIALSAKAWKVTDPMGSNIIYKELTEAKKDNAYSFANNTLTWDVKNSTPVESTTSEGNKKYTYTLSYNVILDTTNANATYNDVKTNGDTILDYYLFSKKDEDKSVELKHASFIVPRVKGLFGEVNFTKFNENNKPMANVLITLSGTATGSNKAVQMTATSASNGNVDFTNIPAGEYILSETTPNGYVGAGPWNVKVSYGNTTKDTTLGDTIVNYPTSRSISVTKSWAGLTSGQSTPESVTVRLYKNNELTDRTLVLNSRNNWTDSFTNLPYIDENGVINYSVKEDKVAGYDTAILESEDGSKFTITNTYNPKLLKIEGVKTWVDQSGAEIDEVVPDIEITLQRTLEDNWDDETKIEDVKTITLTNGNTEYAFENLPKTATNSKEYKYRVRESKVNGYEPTYNDKFDITNTYTPGNTELAVNKLWENVDVEKDTLPKVKVILYQDGIEYRSEVLNSSNGYSYTFTDLPKYAKTGAEYSYTVKESMEEGTVGYSSRQVINEDNSVTITNTFDTTEISVSGIKKWVGVPAGARVPAVKLHLYQNGVELKEKAITLEAGVKENGSEAYVFNNLPKYSTDGKEYTYTVNEDTISGYTSSGEGNKSNNYTITNTFDNENVTVMGEKTWSGVDDLTIVPTITISLESSLDGETWTAVAGKVIELTAGNTKYEFINLPKYASDSTEYKYRVVESHIAGYTTSENGSYNILNTYTPGETAVKVTKTWVNVDPNNDKVPEVNIILKQDGNQVNSIVLDKDNEYTHTFTKLQKYAPTGKEYVYTVEEVLSDDVVGYTKEITS